MNLGDLPAACFSTAKMVYVGYLVLAGLRRIETSLTQFLLMSLGFIAVQVFHDDFLRIRLNYLGVPKAQRDSGGHRR